ncbi:MAG TPA: hypothetical protein VHC69_25505 [Polyangiaceae bacterium]|nr:hypothetical protein [Polyangiaceae bacterium]
MSIEETTKGNLGAFAHFVPFKSLWAYLWQKAVLFSAPQHDDEVRKLGFLQYAHFTRVSASALRRAGVKELKHGGMLFMSAFNGDANAYFRAFSDKVPVPMSALWSGCPGWTSATPYPELEQFIERYRRSVNAYFHGFPLAIGGLRKALELQADVERLVEVARKDPAAFEREYAAVAMHHWGDGKREATS